MVENSNSFWNEGYFLASLESFTELATSEKCFADDKVCVVGLFGNGRSGVHAKSFYANSAIERNVFQTESFYKLTKNDLCEIEIFHDVEQRILYLHLVTVHDGMMLAKLCNALDQNIPLAECHKALQLQEYQFAKTLLFMFSVCHIMVLMQPTQTFDVSYIRLFKLVANTRQQLITVLSQELAAVDGIHDIWKQTGRPCIPRLLCSFQQNRHSQLSGKNAAEVEQNPDSYASRAKMKSQAPPKSPLTNLQHALEDQVYSIMRKSRLLGSLSSSSLFTVNSSHNFVHVQAEEISRSADLVDVLLKKFQSPLLPDAMKSPLIRSKPHMSSETNLNSGHTLFRDFLREQIDNLMTGDGRDGLAEGRRGTHVEVPTIRQWAKVCVCVYGYLTSERSNENSHLCSLAQNLDLEMKFSDARCRKVLPIASNAYLDNLPSHYPQRVHMSKMDQALRVFALNARGPAYETYAIQLQQDCIQMWVSGRQLCEVHSLTGRHCIYPFHIVPGQHIGDAPLIDKSALSCKPHSSRITSLCACNCGRTQAQREDPFDLKSANFDFYVSMEEKCCSNLVHFSFPCHPAGLHDDNAIDANDFPPITAADQHAGAEITVSVVPDEEKPDEPAGEQVSPEQAPSAKSHEGLNKDAKEFVSAHAGHSHPAGPLADHLALPTNHAENTTPAENTNLAGNTNLAPPTHPSGNTNPAGNANLTGTNTPHVVDNANLASHTGSMLSGGYQSISQLDYHKSVTSVGSVDVLSYDVYQCDVIEPRKHRESSSETVDYLECMLSSEQTGGRLPLFASWSLCRHGNANVYQHAKGLDHPGFFSGTNFLLPWDIPLLNESHANLSSYIDGHVKHPGVKSAGVEAWPAPNEVPSAGTNTALPLYQTLVYAARQCTDYNVNPLAISSTSITGAKGGSAAGRNQRGHFSPTVRAYVGNEYECPRGHRFICSSHDKMVKANNAGVVKENASRLVNSDMPLYFPCPCRSNKPFFAQLTRLFIVTPESPVLIVLNPRVQPAPAPCPIFHPGLESGITLPPASFCVLRLPFVYVGLEGPIAHFTDGQPLSNSRLLKGTYGVMRNDRLYDEKEMWI